MRHIRVSVLDHLDIKVMTLPNATSLTRCNGQNRPVVLSCMTQRLVYVVEVSEILQTFFHTIDMVTLFSMYFSRDVIENKGGHK